MRFEPLNEHYVLDTYTGKKLNQKDIIQLLNKYETELQKENGEWLNMAEKNEFKEMGNRTIREIFNELCMKHMENGGIEDVGYLFKMRHPITNEIMDLRVELRG